MNIKTRIATQTMEIQGRTIFKEGQVLILDKQSNGFWVLVGNPLGTGGFTSKEELNAFTRKMTKVEKEQYRKDLINTQKEQLRYEIEFAEDELQEELDDFFADEYAEIEAMRLALEELEETTKNKTLKEILLEKYA